MTGVDLRCEYRAALKRTSLEDLRPLRDAGVGGPGHAIGPAFARIRLSRDRRLFEFDPDSDDVAFILPVRAENPTTPEATDPVGAVRHGPIIDLLALSAAFPHRWALRTGCATWLGAVLPQYIDPPPTPVWQSPLHWLGSDCHGLVLLARDRRDRYRTLTCLGAIVAEDEPHATELRELLARPWLAPPVYVRGGREVRNAP